MHQVSAVPAFFRDNCDMALPVHQHLAARDMQDGGNEIDSAVIGKIFSHDAVSIFADTSVPWFNATGKLLSRRQNIPAENIFNAKLNMIPVW
jgi:hypothetical protein